MPSSPVEPSGRGRTSAPAIARSRPRSTSAWAKRRKRRSPMWTEGVLRAVILLVGVLLGAMVMAIAAAAGRSAPPPPARKTKDGFDPDKFMVESYNDHLVVMQAAWIEWRRGRGAEEAMIWIENTLDGPGLI